jgi:hypothetical protein
MRHSVRVQHADLQAFARVWSVQRERLAWLVGAGTSAAAGIPTAGQIVDDLLTRMYASAFDTVREKLDTGDPAVMARIRTYFDGRNGMPPEGDPSDYSTAFQLALSEPRARAKYFRDLVNDRVPSFGQRVLGAAVVSGAVDLVVTTNFDELLESSMAAAYARHSSGTARLCSVAALGSADRASAAVASDSWPLLIKLHGDYRESQLKNLDSELRTQDERLRQAVIDASRRMGLVVAGYSGRDESVMEMLRSACQMRNAWPAGIWWLHRNSAEAAKEVIDLLEFAAAYDVSANLVEAANFDEAMGALANQVDFDLGIREYVDGLRDRPVAGAAPVPAPADAGFPLLRFNALPVLRGPEYAWRARAADGMTRELLDQRLREVRFQGAAVLASGHVLAVGLADQVQQVAGAGQAPAKVAMDSMSVDADTHVRALAAAALTRGLALRLPVKPMTQRRRCLLVVTEPGEREPDHLADARRALRVGYDDVLTGLVPDPERNGATAEGNRRRFAEGLRLYVEHRLETMWLVFVPFTWMETWAGAVEARTQDLPLPPDPAGPWNRERWARRRRNEVWARLIGAWAAAIAPERPVTQVHMLRRAVRDEDGALDAVFEIGSASGYSRRMT